MICRKCGFNLGAVTTFCPNCGLTVEEMLKADDQLHAHEGGNWPLPYGAATPGTSQAVAPPPAPDPSMQMPANLMSPDTYYLMLNGQQSGPYTVNQMKAMWQAGSISASTYYWQNGMADWQPLANVRAFLDSAGPQYGQPFVVNQGNPAVPYQPQYQMMAPSQKSRAGYVILGLFFGCLGVHNFYAGYAGRGIAQLLITIFTGWIFGIGVLVTFVWALIEIIAVNTDANGLRMS